MAINQRLKKLEEAEHERLNAEYLCLWGLLQTAFSNEEMKEILQANSFEYRQVTDFEGHQAMEKEREARKREIVSLPDLPLKRCIVEDFRRVISKWQTSFQQRKVDPNWDASSLVDEELKQANEEALRRSSNPTTTKEKTK